jgi:hypothetical protein
MVMDSDCRQYVDRVLSWYLRLPDTPSRASRYDRDAAARFHQRRIPLDVIESAFLLATARRRLRDPSLTPLPPVRSLSYFLHVIEEILATPLPAGYVDYLRLKLRRTASLAM